MSGGETANIAEVANLLSSKIFDEFGWTRVKLENQNFDCTSPEAHNGRATHPCDVVFHYDDPYSESRVHVLFDLKSYSADSLRAGHLKTALDSLAQTIECANRSEQWQTRYTSRTVAGSVVGCLFVYIHDGVMDPQHFKYLLRTALRERTYGVPRGQRILTLGLAEISYLHTIANDLRQLRGARDGLPRHEYCYFHYPELVRSRRRSPRSQQASIEFLTGPWQVVSYEQPISENVIKRGHVVYYRYPGASADDFLYLIDFLFRSNLLDSLQDTVQLRMVKPSVDAAAYFDRAKEEYAETFAPSPGFRKFIRDRIATVKFEVIDTVVAQFSEIAIGVKSGTA